MLLLLMMMQVGLLSRSIVLQGSPDSAERNSRGGHVKIEGQGRIEGVLAYRMGQLNTLGAYPFHFHMLGWVNNDESYLKESAVYNSFYRCFVIHGTSKLLVKDNTGTQKARTGKVLTCNTT